MYLNPATTSNPVRLCLTRQDLTILSHNAELRNNRVSLDPGEDGKLYLIYGVSDGVKLYSPDKKGNLFLITIGKVKAQMLGLHVPVRTELEYKLTKIVGRNALEFIRPKKTLESDIPTLPLPNASSLPAPFCSSLPLSDLRTALELLNSAAEAQGAELFIEEGKCRARITQVI